MALLQISKDIVHNRAELLNYIFRPFDTVKLVEENRIYDHYVYRVESEEVPTDDTVLDPELIEIPGVQPFLISLY